MKVEYRLDTDEYLQLALHASGSGDHHAALNYLTSALAQTPEQDPQHAVALYLLAAEHAELGLYRRARDELVRALALLPDMETARFQLGLLCLQLGDRVEALHEFNHLSGNAGEESFRSFAAGLIALIGDDQAAAFRLIEDGLRTCRNEALHADMLRLAAKITEDRSLRGNANAADPAPEEPRRPAPIFLGAYREKPDKN